jgi:hypothetical protein
MSAHLYAEWRVSIYYCNCAPPRVDINELPDSILNIQATSNLHLQNVHAIQVQQLPYVYTPTVSTLLLTKTEKKTWWGCGSHIPSVMDQVPESDRCTCTPKVNADGKEYPPKGAGPA